jgi:hypothetical protein
MQQSIARIFLLVVTLASNSYGPVAVKPLVSSIGQAISAAIG